MGKAVQHPFSLADALHRQTVVLLIQEESGFLSIFHIHQIMHSIFHNLHFRLIRLADPSFDLRKSFFFPLVGITPLIYAADGHAIFRQYFF